MRLVDVPQPMQLSELECTKATALLYARRAGSL
jgi:hypothetical protein